MLLVGIATICLTVQFTATIPVFCFEYNAIWVLAGPDCDVLLMLTDSFLGCLFLVDTSLIAEVVIRNG